MGVIGRFQHYVIFVSFGPIRTITSFFLLFFIFRLVSGSCYLFHKRPAKRMGFLQQHYTQVSCFLRVHQGLMVLVDLRENCAELKVKLAMVSKLMKFVRKYYLLFNWNL